jgi:hypothetical protein
MRRRGPDFKICLECGGKFTRQSIKAYTNFHRMKYCGKVCSSDAARFSPEKANRMFWPKVDKSGGADACWPYYRVDALGYGRFIKAGPFAFAHRTAWQLAKGAIPAGLDVCHTCDNRRCCNPAHMFVGTAKDNMRDMYNKGRQPSKLQPRDVIEIRGSVLSDKELAAKFNVTDNCIRDARLRKKWQHVP